jgi:hypothetical protein
MNRVRAVVILLLAFGQAILAGESRAVQLKWADATQLVLGKQVVVLTAAHRYKGRAVAADAGSLSLEKATIRRVDVAEIRLVEYVGNGRHIGKLVGGGTGLLAGIIGGVAVGLDETGTHKERDKALAVTSIVAGLPAGLAAGYFLGRLADKQTTILRIIPEPVR